MRPLLVLPQSMLVRPNELETVVIHEVTHLRRGDLLVRCLQVLAGTLLFFWPVVAWVNRRIDQAPVSTHVMNGPSITADSRRASMPGACSRLSSRRSRAALAYRPAFMAGHTKTIERRIDVILKANSSVPSRRAWSLASLAFVGVWAVVGLTGMAHAQSQTQYANTPEDMDRHAQAVYAKVGEQPGGDVDGSGEVTKEECWAYVTAAVLTMPDKGTGGVSLGGRERGRHAGRARKAYLFSRGDYDLGRLDKQFKKQYGQAEKGGDKAELERIKEEHSAAQIGAWHVILARRAELIEMTETPPTAEAVKGVMKKIQAEQSGAKKTKIETSLQEIQYLRQQAEDLRAKAETADGEIAEKYLSKAEQLVAKADDHAAEGRGIPGRRDREARSRRQAGPSRRSARDSGEARIGWLLRTRSGRTASAVRILVRFRVGFARRSAASFQPALAAGETSPNTPDTHNSPYQLPKTEVGPPWSDLPFSRSAAAKRARRNCSRFRLAPAHPAC